MKCRPFRGSNATIVPKRPVPMQSICPSLLTSMFPQFSSNIHACVYVVHSTELSFPRSAINAPKHGYVSPENFHSKTTSSLALQPNQAADQNGGRRPATCCPDYCREDSIRWRLRVNGNFFPRLTDVRHSKLFPCISNDELHALHYLLPTKPGPVRAQSCKNRPVLLPGRMS